MTDSQTKQVVEDENCERATAEIVTVESSSKDNLHESICDLSTFELEKVLYNNTKNKTVCLLGSFRDREGAGLVILEKCAFEEKQLQKDSQYFTNASALKKLFDNDIYGNYECFPNIELNPLKTTIIHPATAKHIQKYSIQNSYLIEETPTIHKEIVGPYFENEQFDLTWVYNILDHKSESERIVFEDPDNKTGFVLLPDLKWNGTTLETLYLQAIVHTKDVKSLRDLTAAHLPLLKNIKTKGCNAIKEKYGLDLTQLRIYLHYQPSYYHLHVHFTYLKHEAPGIFAERSHLLATVISNIELSSEYYKLATIPFVVRENDKLFAKLEAAGCVTKLAAVIG